ncbi:MAG: methylenetetrahydrofolate reductase [Rubrobacter sp.]|jgi:methylenetetrahydrofolate reductase (NADPH)|nr:methylenetetrahydrofolate reductase [Rubrobacter sp.]MDQ3054788.1 methylenetetrahydrofolate reductase [Actinomycetota bacterium]
MSDVRNEALVEALAQPRFELIPMEGARERAAHLPEGAKVTVTCSPTQGIKSTLLLGEELLERGFRIVPHIAARLVADRTHLEAIVRRLDDLKVREVFVIGGDARKPVGPFSGAFELLSAMADSGHDFEHVGVGGYPEGHPIIDDGILRQALLDKRPFATYVVSQMCFDLGAILDWVADIRQQGIGLPVYIGLPGVVERKKLLQISLKIGVGDSARFLTKHTNLVTRFLKPGGYSPDELVKELAPYVGDQNYNIAGFHIYTFNQVESTEKWRRKILNFEQADSAVGTPQ